MILLKWAYTPLIERRLEPNPFAKGWKCFKSSRELLFSPLKAIPLFKMDLTENGETDLKADC